MEAYVLSGIKKTALESRKSLYIPKRKVVMSYDGFSVNRILFDHGIVEVARQMVAHDDRAFIGEVNVPDDLVDDLLKAKRALDRKRKSLVNCLDL